MINNAVLTGRLTKDPESRQVGSESRVVNFTLAVNKIFKREGQPDADFIQCVAWNKTADILTQYTSKGSLIGVEGRIETRSYENNEGQRIFVTEVRVNQVTLLESKKERQEQQQKDYSDIFPEATPDVSEDELPF